MCGGRGPPPAASDGDPLGGARHPISSGDEGENAGDGGEGDGGVFWMGFDGDKKPLICAINSSMPPVRLTQVRCSQGPRQQRWESSVRKTTTDACGTESESESESESQRQFTASISTNQNRSIQRFQISNSDDQTRKPVAIIPHPIFKPDRGGMQIDLEQGFDHAMRRQATVQSAQRRRC